jgi:hypothetical protein
MKRNVHHFDRFAREKLAIIREHFGGWKKFRTPALNPLAVAIAERDDVQAHRRIRA